MSPSSRTLLKGTDVLYSSPCGSLRSAADDGIRAASRPDRLFSDTEKCRNGSGSMDHMTTRGGMVLAVGGVFRLTCVVSRCHANLLCFAVNERVKRPVQVQYSISIKY